jgi:AhpD family alkylhydroperoxidase
MNSTSPNAKLPNINVNTAKEFSMSIMDWSKYRNALMGRVGDLQKLSPDTVGGYVMASGAGSKTQHLDEKTRQLISLAVAVTTRCDGCISVHSEKAVKNGATKEEVAEALGVAVAMNAGAALVYSARALDAVDQAIGENKG